MLDFQDQISQYATWVEGQMRPIDLPSDHGRALVGIDSPPVAEVRPDPVVVDLSDARRDPDNTRLPTDRRRPSHRVWLAVAAVTLFALLVGTLVVATSRSSHRRGGLDVASITATGPDSALRPIWMPPGMQLIAVSAHQPGPGGVFPNGSDTPDFTTQLFGTDDRPKVDIRIQTGRSAQDRPTDGIVQTVRGQSGQLFMADHQATEVSSDSSTSLEPVTGAHNELIWSERGVLVTASFKDLSSRAALDFVNSLTWIDQTASSGFAAPSGSDLTTLVAPTAAHYSGSGVQTELTYEDPASGRYLAITTCPEGIGRCDAVHESGFADTWFDGSRNADGSASAYGSLGSDAGASGIQNDVYIQAWPHGGMVEVRSGDGRTLDLDAAKHIAASVELTDFAGLSTQRAEISARLHADSLIAAADLPSGHLELRDGGHNVGILCVDTTTTSTVCQLVTAVGLSEAESLSATGVVVDGHWVVVAVSRQPAPLVFTRQGTDTTPLGGEQSVIVAGHHSYLFGLVQVPDDVSAVTVMQSGSGIGVGRTAF